LQVPTAVQAQPSEHGAFGVMTHVPVPQVLHAPSHAELQHTPSEQNPVAQSVFRLHFLPLRHFAHEPPPQSMSLS